MRPPIAGSTLLSAHPAGMRRCGYDTRSMPGQESNPESKLRIRLMPALCMTATCNASLADRSCRVSSSERARFISAIPNVRTSSGRQTAKALESWTDCVAAIDGR